ncbi:MAG TPA: thioredoxin domain-containing protein, partial [Methanobacterium sp.]|nr:thioredoxin domain-containing protein [Methanobacterium sp.]
VPHFEKMLYDQAITATAYIEAFQATGCERYRDTAQEIFEYILRDMQSPEGGFYSAEDADSEGVEGKFYVWTKDEIYKVLGEENAKFASKIFNVNSKGNFSEEPSQEKTGSNILHIENSPDEISETLGIKKEDIKRKIEETRKILFNTREKRVHPHKDDKILTDWNGLMISALSKGAQVFDNEKYLNAAMRSADFIIDNLCDNNRLLHRYRDGEAAIDGKLDDYAFFISGLLELYEASFNLKYLKSAIDLNNILLDHFWDNENGGFYFTPDDGEEILVRKKEIYDSTVPSGNSMQMLNLLKLSKITEDEEFKHKAVQLEKAFSHDVVRTPSAHTQLMVAIDFKLGPSYEIVIAGTPNNQDTDIMLNSIRSSYIPNKTIVLKPPEASEIIGLINSLKFKNQENNKATVYICSENTCKAPTTDLNTMLKFLNVP